MLPIDLYLLVKGTGFLTRTDRVKMEIDYHRMMVIPTTVNPKALANDNDPFDNPTPKRYA